MKKLKNKILLITLIMCMIIGIQGNVQASGAQAYRINSQLVNQTVSYFFELIRAMETTTGTLGKASNIATSTDYTDSSANGIDCHLEKSTENGTVTLLAASEYGNVPTDSTECTAANNTGVFDMNNGKWEYTATIYKSSANSSAATTDYNGALVRADSRYVNEYVGDKHSITGDGLIETDGWRWPLSLDWYFLPRYEALRQWLLWLRLRRWQCLQCPRSSCGGGLWFWTLKILELKKILCEQK